MNLFENVVPILCNNKNLSDRVFLLGSEKKLSHSQSLSGNLKITTFFKQTISLGF